jgi:hypothetical protein
MSTYTVPSTSDTEETLSMLFGDDTLIKSGKALDIKAGNGNFIAIYVNDTGSPVAASMCDVAFAAFAGSSLSMIPAGGARDAVKSRDLSEDMLNNLNEVMNIISSLFMDKNTPHLRLDTIYGDAGELPENALAIANTPAGRVDYEVDIPRYGKGMLSLLVT